MTEHTVREVYEEIRLTGSPAGMSYDEIATHYAYSLPTEALTFSTVDEMRRIVESSGSHYFDRDAVRMFRGRTDTHVYGRRFWVESRKYVNHFSGDSWPREYQVAYLTRYGDNISVEKIGNYSSLDAARRAAARLATAVNNALEA